MNIYGDGTKDCPSSLHHEFLQLTRMNRESTRRSRKLKNHSREKRKEFKKEGRQNVFITQERKAGSRDKGGSDCRGRVELEENSGRRVNVNSYKPTLGTRKEKRRGCGSHRLLIILRKRSARQGISGKESWGGGGRV